MINTEMDAQNNLTREKLTLTQEQGRELIYGDLDGYTVIKDKIVDHNRWSVIHKIIVQRNSDGKYFQDHYSVGATENQDEGPYEWDNPSFTEVFPVETTIIEYI